MGMFEWFFPEVAEAEHLRSISQQLARTTGRSRATAAAKGTAADELAEDVGFLALVLLTLLDRLVEKKVITREEIVEQLRQLDRLDGLEDGKLDLSALRVALRVPSPARPEPSGSDALDELRKAAEDGS